MASQKLDLIAAGESIKPVISRRQLDQLALELYALRILDVSNLDSYDDLNFHIVKAKLDDVIPEDKEEPEYVNPNIEEVHEDGYVLKVVSTHASARPSAYDMQTELMFHLHDQGLICPQPVRNIEGQYFELKTLYLEDEDGNKKSEEKRIHLVCLLTYVRGEELLKHPNLNVGVFFEAGQFAGRVTAALRKFDHEHFSNNSRSIWDMKYSSHLRKYMYATPSPAKRTLISNVLDEFEKNVMPHFNKFQTSVLHGDYTDQNILFNWTEDRRPLPVIDTIIDFGDVSKSFMVFDVAILMMYLMCMDMGDQFLWTGGKILQGFRTQVALNAIELNHLRFMVMMRYATNIVMSYYTVKMDPSNAFYLTSRMERAWQQLKQMWETPGKDVEKAWQLRT